MKINTTNISVEGALAYLRSQGYAAEFQRDPFCLYCVGSNMWITSEEFKVDEYYYFEVISSPDADRILFAISSDIGIKGILVEACGVYADSISLEMAEKLAVTETINHQFNLKQ